MTLALPRTSLWPLLCPSLLVPAWNVVGALARVLLCAARAASKRVLCVTRTSGNLWLASRSTATTRTVIPVVLDRDSKVVILITNLHSLLALALDTGHLVVKALLVLITLLELFDLDLLAVFLEFSLFLGFLGFLDSLRLFNELGAYTFHVLVRLDHLGVVVGWAGEGNVVLCTQGACLGNGVEG